MLSIAGKTAGPNGLKFFQETQRLKNLFFFIQRTTPGTLAYYILLTINQGFEENIFLFLSPSPSPSQMLTTILGVATLFPQIVTNRFTS